MVDVPAPTPVTRPPAVIVATPPVTLLHTPPAGLSDSNVVKVWHTVSVPRIAPGCVFTVTTCVATHDPKVYDIVVVPAVSPLTLPDPSTVPTPRLVLDHVPPPVASVRAVTEPTHTCGVPVIATGVVLTVICIVAIQPAPKLYVITATPPPAALTPVTMPVPAPTVAVPVALLVHAPPLVASVRVMEDPSQTVEGPEIAVGDGFTVTMAVIRQPVGSV